MRVLGIIFFISFGYSSFSQTYADKVLAMKGINDNKRKLAFLKIAVNNYGNDALKKQMSEADKHDFEANSHFMQVRYKEAYESINQSLLLQIKIYRQLFDIYYEDVEKMLTEAIKTVVDDNNKVARELLREAFAQLSAAKKLGSELKDKKKFNLEPNQATTVNPSRYALLIEKSQLTLNYYRMAKQKYFDSVRERGYIILPKYNRDRNDIALKLHKTENNAGPSKIEDTTAKTKKKTKIE